MKADVQEIKHSVDLGKPDKKRIDPLILIQRQLTIDLTIYHIYGISCSISFPGKHK